MPFPYRSVRGDVGGNPVLVYCDICLGMRFVAGPHVCPKCKGAGVLNDDGSFRFTPPDLQFISYTTNPDPAVNAAPLSVICVVEGNLVDAPFSYDLASGVNQNYIYDSGTLAPAYPDSMVEVAGLFTMIFNAAPAAGDYIVSLRRSSGNPRRSHAVHLTIT